MKQADGPFHKKQGVKGEVSRKWMIAMTRSVSNLQHNQKLKDYSPQIVRLIWTQTKSMQTIVMAVVTEQGGRKTVKDNNYLV